MHCKGRDLQEHGHCEGVDREANLSVYSLRVPYAVLSRVRLTSLYLQSRSS